MSSKQEAVEKLAEIIQQSTAGNDLTTWEMMSEAILAALPSLGYYQIDLDKKLWQDEYFVRRWKGALPSSDWMEYGMMLQYETLTGINPKPEYKRSYPAPPASTSGNG
jgi:hypothetical protein